MMPVKSAVFRLPVQVFGSGTSIFPEIFREAAARTFVEVLSIRSRSESRRALRGSIVAIFIWLQRRANDLCISYSMKDSAGRFYQQCSGFLCPIVKTVLMTLKMTLRTGRMCRCIPVQNRKAFVT